MQKKVKKPWDKYFTEESMAYKAAGDELKVIFLSYISLIMRMDGHTVLSSHYCGGGNNMLLFSLSYRLQTLAFVIRYTLQ